MSFKPRSSGAPISADSPPGIRRHRGRRYVATAAIIGAPLLALSAFAPSAVGAPVPAEAHSSGSELLRQIDAPTTTTADGPVWSPTATGFASVPTDALPDGTTGGAGGEVVTVDDAAELSAAAASAEPLTVLVDGTIDVGDGSMIRVAADKTIVGASGGGEIVNGGLLLDRVSNVIIRNLTFRDSFIGGDWDGKSPENDNDGIRVDTSHHVWVDHNEFARLGDGQLDIRKDSTDVTASWNYFRDHNKTLGVGWTDNVVTTLTLHHNRFSNVHQRNGSLDNVAAGHVYNNWLSGVSSYGMNARGAETELVVESNVFEHARNPLIGEGSVFQQDNIFEDVWGEAPRDTGPTFDATEHYAYTADAVDDVRKILEKDAGPVHRTGDDAERRVTVAQDGTGDYLSLHAAVGAASRSAHPVEVVVQPGTYREVVSIWPDADKLTIRGATGDPKDVVITYDKASGDWPTVNVLADAVMLQSVTLENPLNDPAAPKTAYALRSAGVGITLDDVVVLGDTLFEGEDR
ncbi:pectinesterase family protein [Microbacterium sp. M28]|uniref:pectate lyase family protein n=1 Tax=Microbacterium sp. M28 TaxID=2962064 RepID=UPI0021F3CEDA|nr:right-handed parallel beta-helix repeat-containing protein [Microbacterium sp. M28]UYO97251.1 pectinesterase family protein [Microbacterium sp. M28]